LCLGSAFGIQFRVKPDVDLPEFIYDDAELDEILTRPSAELVKSICSLQTPLVILGAGGKMGPTLAVLARRAAEAANHHLEVIAVSRFSDDRARQWLEERGVRTLNADLLDRDSLAKLPDSANVVYLVGLKFGTAQNPSLTWAVNTLAAAHAAERYAGARIVALSTGNVYPLVSTATSGATETHPLTPLGEYANAAVARERVFDYFSRKDGTRIALMRLNYAVELRYGVLVDIARKIWSGEPVDLSNGFFNCIWQGDANDMIVRAFKLAASPSLAWNLTGPVLRVREVAEQSARLLGKPVQFVGAESDTALLSDSRRLWAEVGPPPTATEDVLRWTAHWVKSGGRSLGKPTHFEVRDGSF
jgi:nucleoside-diphosphate-sugar epimerase